MDIMQQSNQGLPQPGPPIFQPGGEVLGGETSLPLTTGLPATSVLTSPPLSAPTPAASGSFKSKLASAIAQAGLVLLGGGKQNQIQQPTVDANGNIVNPPQRENPLQNAVSDIGMAQKMARSMPPGAQIGVLEAASNLFSARKARQQQEIADLNEQDRQALLRAHTTLQMQQIRHQMAWEDEDHKQTMIKNLAPLDASWAQNHKPVADDLTDEQYKDLVQQSGGQSKFDEKYMAIPIGQQPVLGPDNKPEQVNGVPATKTLWKVYERNEQMETVSPAMAAVFKSAGMSINEGDEMPTSTLNFKMTQATNVAAAVANIDKIRSENLSFEQKQQLFDSLDNLDKYHVVVPPGNPIGMYRSLQQGAEQHLTAINQQIQAAAKQGNAQQVSQLQEMAQMYRDEQKDAATVLRYGFTQKDVDAYDTAQETHRHNIAEEQLNKQKEYDLMHPPGGAPGNIPQTTGLQQQIAELRTANPSAANLLSKFDNGTQASLMAVAFGDGSTSFDDAFPTRLYKGQAGLARKDAIGVIRQLNPNWSEQQYKVTQQAYKELVVVNSKAIQQYNNFIQHAAEATGAFNEIARKGPRIWNMALNVMQNAGYGTDATRLMAALEPPRGEIKLLMSGGYKPNEDESKDFDRILSNASTPAQISQAFKELGVSGMVRLDNINEAFKRITGKNIASIIDPETLTAAQNLGLPPEAMQRLHNLDSSGTIFDGQTPQTSTIPPRNTPVPPTRRPVMQNGTIIGYTTDGKTMIPVGQAVGGR